MNFLKFAALIVVTTGLCLSTPVMAEKTTINHGNGDKSTIKSDRDGSTIERGQIRESTRESHKEAVDRVTRESKDRGERATREK